MLLCIWLNISWCSSFKLFSYNNLNYIFRCTQFCQNSNHWLESLFMVIVFSTYLHVHWLWIWEQRYNQIICLLISFIVGSGGQRSGPPTAFVSLFIIRMPLYFPPFFFYFFLLRWFFVLPARIWAIRNLMLQESSSSADDSFSSNVECAKWRGGWDGKGVSQIWCCLLVGTTPFRFSPLWPQWSINTRQ